MIRRATQADAAAIQNIWNALIRDTTVTFNSIPKEFADVTDFIAQSPVFVAQADNILGYASYGPFRPGVGYERIAEHSIVLTENAQGCGHGRALLEAVMMHAKGCAITSLIAGVSAENAPGYAFHKHMGFVEVGRIPKAGHKFDRDIDLVLMQKHL